MKIESSNSISTNKDPLPSSVSSIILALGALSRQEFLTPVQQEATGIALLCYAEHFLIGSESLTNWFSALMQEENVATLKDCLDAMLQTFYSRAKSDEVIQ